MVGSFCWLSSLYGQKKSNLINMFQMRWTYQLVIQIKLSYPNFNIYHCCVCQSFIYHTFRIWLMNTLPSEIYLPGDSIRDCVIP